MSHSSRVHGREYVLGGAYGGCLHSVCYQEVDNTLSFLLSLRLQLIEWCHISSRLSQSNPETPSRSCVCFLGNSRSCQVDKIHHHNHGCDEQNSPPSFPVSLPDMCHKNKKIITTSPISQKRKQRHREMPKVLISGCSNSLVWI